MISTAFEESLISAINMLSEPNHNKCDFNGHKNSSSETKTCDTSSIRQSSPASPVSASPSESRTMSVAGDSLQQNIIALYKAVNIQNLHWAYDHLDIEAFEYHTINGQLKKSAELVTSQSIGECV